MYIDPKIVAQRAEDPNNLVIKHRRSRETALVKRSPEERQFFGVMAAVTSGSEVERTFGVPKATANAYSKGIVNKHHGVDHELKQAVAEGTQDAKKSISEAALNTLTSALGLIDAKLPNVSKATDLARISKDMAFVADKMNPAEVGRGFGLQVIIHSVGQRKVDDYEVIDA